MIRPLLLAAVMLLTPPPARAHDWFTGKSDPKSNEICCGGQDCREVPDEMLVAGVVQETDQGYLLTLSREQIHYFAPATQFDRPFQQLVPWARVQPSETGRFALCIIQNQVRCFFAPLNT